MRLFCEDNSLLSRVPFPVAISICIWLFFYTCCSQLGDGFVASKIAPPSVDTLTGALLPSSSLTSTASATPSVSPSRLVVPPITRTIDANSGFACALTATGGVRCWGRNANGQVSSAASFSILLRVMLPCMNCCPCLTVRDRCPSATPFLVLSLSAL